MLNCGIYKITNTINNKAYIGSSKSIKRRWQNHKVSLKNNKHHSQYLQRSYNKYKKENFIFKILLFCSEKDLLFFETRALKFFNSLDNVYGYNCKTPMRCDLEGSNLDDWKEKLSQTHISRGCSVGENNPFFGKRHTEEAKHRMSKSKQGLYVGKKSVLFGKHPSVEARQKMSDSRPDISGKNNPMYGVRICGKDNHKAKPVIINGKYYDTINEAAEDINVTRQTLRFRLQKSKPGYSWANKEIK